MPSISNTRKPVGLPKASTTHSYPTANAAVNALERRHGKRAGLWTYHDSAGQPCMVVVRFDGKDGKEFRPIHLGEEKRWVIGAMPKPRVLYRFPDLEYRDLVVVCEGEKAADAAANLGFPSTTSPGGAKAAAAAQWSWLAGKTVAILPDNDAPGRQYAADVKGILEMLDPPAKVKVVELPGLPPKGDIVEWIAARRGKPVGEVADELAELIDAAPASSTPTSATTPPADPTPGHRNPSTAFAASAAHPDGGDNGSKPTSTASTASAAPEKEEATTVKTAEWPDPIGEEAFHGLAGEIVDVLDPGSEADRVAVLAQVLVMFGSLIGRQPHYCVSGSSHRCNMFVVLVGPTAAGRKGTSFDMARKVFDGIEDEWLNGRVMNGLSSGEGALWAIRDPITKRVEVRQRGCAPTYEDVEADPGVSDKRLLVQEPEFANVLKQMERQGNTLSMFLRQAWDSPPVMRTMTKNDPTKASDPHVSLIGHITGAEFTRSLTSTEAANGGANRNAILCVRRSKVLPDGGVVDPVRLAVVREKLRQAVTFAKGVGEVKRHADATPLWHGVYEMLTEGGGGLHGSLTARAAPIVLRVAMIYALMGSSQTIRPAHLMAGIAFWDYCDRSTAFLFCDRTGNPLADEIRDQLRAAPNGMTRTEIQAALGKHQYGDRLTQALQALELAKLAQREKEQTGGRAAERWRATAGGGVESALMATARRLYSRCGESGESGESPRAEHEPPPVWDDSNAFDGLMVRAGWDWAKLSDWLNREHSADLPPGADFDDVLKSHRKAAAEHLARLAQAA